MAADNELPVWSFRANWAEPVMERLTWLTDVLASSYGTEQRRALRLSPRREFEIKFNPVDEARSYFELFLHRFGSQEFMVPLYHDAARLADDVSPGPGTLSFDTTYREFVAGGMAIIMGADPFSCDVVNVTAVNADGIDVTGVTRSWPKGANVHPLRRARVDQESALTAITTHVGDATILFQLNQANDIPDEGAWGTLFGGYPVLTDKPNRRENVDLTLARNSLILDNDHGLRELGDDAGRAFTIQSHMTMQRGRAEHWAFRQFLYRLRGQQGSIWIPTFNHDLRLSQPYTAGDAALKVKKLGYALTGEATSGRRFIRFYKDGTLGEISDTGVPPSGSEESLVLDDPLAVNLPAGSIASFMDTCRLAGDQVEITHHTSTDGVAECNLSWRSFRDERTIPNPIEFPIPFAIKSVDACGTPAEAGCVPDLGPGSTGPATDGTGDPAGYIPGPGEPGYYEYSSYIAVASSNYAYGEPPQTGPDVGDEHNIAPTSFSPDDVGNFALLRRDLLIQGPTITRPWLSRDFPETVAYVAPNVHTASGLDNPLPALPYPTDGTPKLNGIDVTMPFPACYYTNLYRDSPTTWQRSYVYTFDDPAPYIAAVGGPFHEAIEYWDIPGADGTPQIKKITGVGAIIGHNDPNPDYVWIADENDAPFGVGWYILAYYNYVKYFVRIGLVE